VGNDGVAALGELASYLVCEQKPVLIGEEKPGATALTRMCGEYSWAMCTASHWVKLLTAALAPE